MYETKVVDMTQKIPLVIHTYQTRSYKPCNPTPAQLTRAISKYEAEGWEVVSIDVKPDSAWWGTNYDESTTVIFRREKSGK